MKYFNHSERMFIFKHVVLLSDIDQFRHMSFANYLKLMFLAKDALFVSITDLNFFSDHRTKFLDSALKFQKQTSYGDQILIQVRSSDIVGSQFTLSFTFIMEGSGELVASGYQTYELVSNSSTVSVLPGEVKSILDAIFDSKPNFKKVIEI